MSTQRQPKGVPVGGQFAESAHDEAFSDLSGQDDRWQEANELLDAYRSRVVDHGGDVTSDAIDMIDAIDSGEFDTMHTPEARREARAVLEHVSSLSTEDARDLFYEEGSLLDNALGEETGKGKFSTLDERLLYDLGDSMWSGTTEAPTGNFTVVHDNGTHAVIRENSDGVVTFDYHDTEDGAESAFTKLESQYLAWEQDGEEFVSLDTDSGETFSVRYDSAAGGYSIHDDDDNVVGSFASDSDEEMQVEEQARKVLSSRGKR